MGKSNMLNERKSMKPCKCLGDGSHDITKKSQFNTFKKKLCKKHNHKKGEHKKKNREKKHLDDSDPCY